MLPSLRTLSSVGKMTQTSAAKQPRALVFGLGAIGGIYAAILKRSNVCDVSIVARSTYDGVKKHGLRFNSEKHGNEVAQFGENGESTLRTQQGGLAGKVSRGKTRARDKGRTMTSKAEH